MGVTKQPLGLQESWPGALRYSGPSGCVITKAALSSQLFKDPECWSGRGLNPRPPAQQTGAFATELTRQRLKPFSSPCFGVLLSKWSRHFKILDFPTHCMACMYNNTQMGTLHLENSQYYIRLE